MTQSKNFGFGEDETMLRDSARKFFADNCTPDKIHSQVANDPNIHREIESIWDKSLWHQICELGWTAACIPEKAGGVGMPTVAAIALAEEAGNTAFPSPLLTTFNSIFLLQACGLEKEHIKKTLGEIVSGRAATIAITNRQGSWESTDTDVAVTNGRLIGTAWFVQDARKSDFIVVAARSEVGIGLYLVDSSADGITIVPDGIIDLTRDQAHIEFDKVEAIELAPPGEGSGAIDKAMPAILCITSADMVGSAEWLLQTTTDYASTRIQFDRPLGFFQAVKHPLVNMMIAIDQARSLTYNAACALDEEPEEAEKLARMAKSAASDMAVFSANRSVQFHGGIGFTWVCYVHLFFKRLMHNHVLYGDGKYQRTRLAELLMGAPKHA